MKKSANFDIATTQVYKEILIFLFLPHHLGNQEGQPRRELRGFTFLENKFENYSCEKEGCFWHIRNNNILNYNKKISLKVW